MKDTNLKITLTHNTPSDEAIKRFVKKSLELYNRILERERNEAKEGK